MVQTQPQPQPQPLIQLKGIRKAFGDNIVLDDLNLNVYKGEALVILGPSGTGKSTILRIIAGLLRPDAGEVYIKGQRRRGTIEDGEEIIGISMVFQQAALFDSLTVGENVGFLLYQHSKLPPNRIRALVEQKLETVGLEGTSELYPAALSGGMRKRVSFARAVMSDPDDPHLIPEVILYDEPTAGLDPIASTVVEDLVRHLQRSAETCGTYVMVSHQESTIRRTADRVIFLSEGKVRWQGSIEEIDTTDNPWVRQFFSASTEGPIQIVS